ncbi:enoyl-CoA hydratase [Mycolicibacterium sarraceniae]|uniref:Enoyl-CoA hydratase n=1 Tax=Mycolicibacterium sarraceniae TaxID=1534348 RepID=A0A7I7STR8_9MYCO|nr:enoyl-CoA hydratase [Mycolicibacterium sarraceniae]
MPRSGSWAAIANVPAVSDYQTLSFEQSGPIARIVLDRPDAANGMNDDMTAELAQVAQRCDVGEIKAVVLTGAGRFFCAGGDLKAMAASPLGPGPFVKGIADDLHRAISTLAQMDAVLITAVNGVAAGAGFSLAVAGDLVLAADNASFTMAYTKAGLSPDGGASYYLPRIIGVRRTQELMLTNRTLKAPEAADWGLVTEVVPAAELEARAQALAEQIASGAKGSSGAVKKLLLATFGSGLEEQMNLEARLIGECADSADGREGIDAFLNKRAPEFS